MSFAGGGGAGAKLWGEGGWEGRGVRLYQPLLQLSTWS